jgi:hypothetical protein
MAYIKELPKLKFFDTESIGSDKFRKIYTAVSNARSGPRWCPNFGLKFAFEPKFGTELQHYRGSILCTTAVCETPLF